jgi:hypothetical protein
VDPRSPPIDETMMMLPSRRAHLSGAHRLHQPVVGDDVVVQNLAELLIADLRLWP